MGVRKKTLPNGRGIELESSSGKIWTLSPEGNDTEYNGWLDTLRNIVIKQNIELYKRTKDNELRKDVVNIRSSKLETVSKNVINALVTNVDAYNVDMVEVVHTEPEEEDIGWESMEVNDEIKSDDLRKSYKSKTQISKISANRGVSHLSMKSVGIKPKSIRSSITVPKAETRYTEFTSHRGYIKRRGGNGIFSRWKREYMSLWRSCMIYLHGNENESNMFYNGNNSSNKVKGEINMKEIVSVRPVRKKALPNGRGIELESSSGKIWTISPEGNDTEYNGWLNTLRNIVIKQNIELYKRTKDNELRKDVVDIRSSKLETVSKNVINALVTNVDAYNVDMVEVVHTEPEEEDIGWESMEVNDEIKSGDLRKSYKSKTQISKISANRGVSHLSMKSVGIKPKSIRSSITVPKAETRYTE